MDCGALQVLFVALKRTFKCPSPNCDEPSAGPSMEAEAESEEETAEDLGLREVGPKIFPCAQAVPDYLLTRPHSPLSPPSG